MEWVAKITTVSLEMALPAIGGGYLDSRLGTSYWALVGVIVGVVVGMWHLLQMTRPRSTPSRGRNAKQIVPAERNGNTGSGSSGDDSRST
jgi:hypothetical protein